jgi:2-polyprenyl-3-methyl-5-hydroxy-6-metoxy-1,4-benzoquinol methylase
MMGNTAPFALRKPKQPNKIAFPFAQQSCKRSEAAQVPTQQFPDKVESFSTAHSAEVRDGQRFEFGKNWSRFLRSVDERRIAEAETDLRSMFGCARMDGQTFLDVGCGSGLSSLAARRLGATVTSFDYDPASVACTEKLRERFRGGDTGWAIQPGSALDRIFLNSLGEFDFVLSWGVLHHTGAMWEALGNMVDLVKPSGRLYIAIYNDQGLTSKFWKAVKRTYNSAPRPLQPIIASPFAVYTAAGMTVADLLRRRRPRFFSRSVDMRGMSFWTDVIDWVGGYPFEVAKPEEIFDFFCARGFTLTKLTTCGGKLGCNRFAFRREA